MSKITLLVRSRETELDFSAEGVQEDHIGQVIEGMFATLGTQSAPEKKESNNAVAQDPPSKLPTPAKPETSSHKPNSTVVTGNPQSMEEVFTDTHEEKTPLHYKTGYKMKEGVRHYKCRYRCPKCSNAGSHYIPEGVNQVDCHECQTTMQVKKATPGTQGIQPDKFLNWHVAGDQLPVSEFVYGQAKKVQ